MVWIDNARIAAVGAVVFLHVASPVVKEADPVGSISWWIGNLCDSAGRWGVPVFVMISGMLLLDPGKTESAVEFYRKRASRVLVPLAFWTVFFLLWVSKGPLVRGEGIPWLFWAERTVTGRPFYHMWFLYMIVGFYLFVPFLRKIVRQSSPHELLFLVATLFGISMANFALNQAGAGHDQLFINRFLLYLPFFLAGHLIGSTPLKLNRMAVLLVFLLSVVLTSLGCYLSARRGNLTEGMYFYGDLSVTVVPMSVSMMFLLKGLSFPLISAQTAERLASLTLGIYLIHPVFIDALDLFGISPLLFHPALSIPLMAVLVFGVSLAVVQGIYLTPYVRRIV